MEGHLKIPGMNVLEKKVSVLCEKTLHILTDSFAPMRQYFVQMSCASTI